MKSNRGMSQVIGGEDTLGSIRYQSKSVLQPYIFEFSKEKGFETESKILKIEAKVDRKVKKEARQKYQSFRLGMSEIRDLDNRKLLDLKNS